MTPPPLAPPYSEGGGEHCEVRRLVANDQPASVFYRPNSVTSPDDVDRDFVTAYVVTCRLAR